MYQRILLTVDGSPPSNAGLAETLKLTKLTSARARARVQHGANEIPILMGGGGIVLGTTVTVPTLRFRATSPESHHMTSTYSTQTRTETP
jgi:hypothetical protein